MITVQVLGWPKEKFHYYLDLNDRYVYFYEPVNVEYFAMNNWSFLQSGSMGHRSQRY
ncbi:GAPES1 domain-containing protein [Escherichia coli]